MNAIDLEVFISSMAEPHASLREKQYGILADKISCVIFRYDDTNWKSSRSCYLAPLYLFLWSYVKYQAYANAITKGLGAKRYHSNRYSQYKPTFV